MFFVLFLFLLFQVLYWAEMITIGITVNRNVKVTIVTKLARLTRVNWTAGGAIVKDKSAKVAEMHVKWN